MAGIVLEFVLLASVIVVAGSFLARSADRIAELTGLGRLLVGSILLAGATSLPELAVDVSAVRLGLANIAVGDLFGSNLSNLLILAVLDLSHRSRGKMLSRQAAAHALSGTLGMALIGLAGMALFTAQHVREYSMFGVSLWSLVIAAAYLSGMRLIFLDQRIAAQAVALKIKAAENGQQGGQPPSKALRAAILQFVLAAAAVLVTGPRFATVAGRLAEASGLGTTFVGTALVAVSTSLPELVASLTAMRLGSFDLIVGNVFGSNAFNMLLLVVLDVACAEPLFAAVSPMHVITCLAVVVATAVAVLGQLYRVERRRPIIEPDAWLIVVIAGVSLFLVYRLSV